MSQMNCSWVAWAVDELDLTRSRADSQRGDRHKNRRLDRNRAVNLPEISPCQSSSTLSRLIDSLYISDMNYNVTFSAQ